jgi:group I intron endonuclease
MKIVGYRTENLLNGHFYYGVRTLRREIDPYLGSGLRLQKAIKKYGKTNFKRTDLAIFSTFDEALQWERKILTEEMIKDPNCYNLKPGGAGGSLPWTEEKKKQIRDTGAYKKSEEARSKMSTIALDRFKNEPGTFTGKNHTKEARKKMSDSKKGKTGKNKGKKLKLTPERRAELKKPKSKEVRDKISE